MSFIQNIDHELTIQIYSIVYEKLNSVQLPIDHEENSFVVFSVISNYLKKGKRHYLESPLILKLEMVP